MFKCVIFISLFIAMCVCNELDSIQFNANKTIFSTLGVELWRMDNTLSGAVIRTARRITDDIFVQVDIAELPVTLSLPEMPSETVDKLVLEFCNLSFKCEKMETCVIFGGVLGQPNKCELYKTALRVDKRVFISP
jgi:hypothetical protein